MLRDSFYISRAPWHMFWEPNQFPGNPALNPDGTSASTESGATFHWRNPVYIGRGEGRVSAPYRAVAKAQDPFGCALPMASIYYARQTPLDTARARAYADLSATGRAAYAKFIAAPLGPPKDSYCLTVPAKAKAIAASCGSPGALPADQALIDGCRNALSRAYEVVNYLRWGQALPPASKKPLRLGLGYIGVSGEDDLPHRPVNVPSSDYPQYDAEVTVETPLGTAADITLNTRYIVAQKDALQIPGPPVGLTLAPPLPRSPLAADAEVILFIHGMDSRAEEAEMVARRLIQLRNKIVVISVDLPTSGYAETLDHSRVSSLNELGGGVSFSGKAPLLDFIETFVVRFTGSMTADMEPRQPSTRESRPKARIWSRLNSAYSLWAVMQVARPAVSMAAASSTALWTGTLNSSRSMEVT